ncbi:MAG: hemerythrin domain-containing protein [Dehalococcoidia bacterium]
MKRDTALVRLSEEHHHGLVFSLRIERELPTATRAEIDDLYADLLRFWTRGLLPHFRTEGECLLARLIRHVPADHADMRRLEDDHLAITALVVRMRDARGDTELRRESLAEFGVALRAHIRWEEREFFGLLQDSLTRDELDAIGVEVLERHEKPAQAPWEDATG